MRGGVRHSRIICLVLIFCITLLTPVLAVTINGMDRSYGSTGQYITRFYNYVLDGRQGTLPLALSTKLYEGFLEKKPTGIVTTHHISLPI